MIKFAISTNIDYYKTTLPIIIGSMLDAGISKKDIVIFNSGFSEKRVETIDGIEYRFLNHDTYEYSALIDIVESDLDTIYWFLIHDTCKVGRKFKERVYSSIHDLPEKIAIKGAPSMSIGLYRYDYLQSVRTKILGIKNYNFSSEAKLFWKSFTVTNEDYILWKTDPKPQIANGIDRVDNLSDDDNWYGTGTKRITEYYESFDLYKNKSNWGQTGDKPTSFL